MTKKVSMVSKKAENKIDVIGENFKRLFENDELFHNQLQQLYRTMLQTQQQPLRESKEFHISDTALSVKSYNAHEDLNKLLHNKEVKKFIGYSRNKKCLQLALNYIG